MARHAASDPYCQAVPVAVSVCLSVRRLSYSCTLHLSKGSRCLLANKRVGSNDTLCETGITDPKGGSIWMSNPQPKDAIASPMLPPGEYKREAIPPFAKVLRSLFSLSHSNIV